MAQVQTRILSTASPPAAVTVSSQQKTPSSGLIVGMTVHQPTPTTQALGLNGNSSSASVVNGQVCQNPAQVKTEGAPGPPPIQNTSNTNVANTKEKTPMCLINELARFNKIQHQYRLTDESGPAHKKTFTVLLSLGEEEYEASGLSIKKAQHAAASTALEKTNYKHPTPKPRRTIAKLCLEMNDNASSDTLTPTVELNALAMKRGEPAVYHVLNPNRGNPYMPQNFNFRGSYKQRYHYQKYPPPCYISLKVGNHAFMGEGCTTQAARHNAAEKALRILRNLPLPEVSAEIDSSEENKVQEIYEDDELKSPISLVHEVALKRNLRVDFEVIRESGPPHMRNFVTKCVVGNSVTEGDGNGKKLSKKRAAEKMLQELKKLPPLSPTILKVKKKPNTVKKKSRNLIKDQKGNPDYGQGINPISRLIQIQQAKKEKEPVYSLVDESGMPCRREFIMQVQVGSHTCTGTGPNKKLAKRSAAEGLLQLLGYSRPPPCKLTVDAEKNRKVTFLEQDSLSVDKADGEGRSGRQLVPGLLLMSDTLHSGDGVVGIQSFQHQLLHGQNMGLNRAPGSQLLPQDSTIATIAKELLDHGVSPTAEAILKPGQKLSTTKIGSHKQQLSYLADVSGFSVQYTDFPRGNKCEYLSLVSLSINPPHVSHGSGDSLEASNDQAALAALRALSSLSLEAAPDIQSTLENLQHIGVSQNGTAQINPSLGGTVSNSKASLQQLE